MDILLINPPDTTALDSEMDPPFNLMMIAAALKKHGITSQIAELCKGIPDNIPLAKMYGITVTTATYTSGEQVSTAIRSKYPEAKIVVGGSHTFGLDVEYADLTISGRCLGNVHELLSLNGHHRGVQCLNNGYPLPWNLVTLRPYKRYVPEATSTLSYITSIGCPFNCKFCCNYYNKQPYDVISQKSFIRDMDILIRDKLIDGINFMDDNFLLRMDLLNIISRYNIKWRAMVPSSGTFNYSDLYKSGCRYLVIGIESGSKRMLSLMNKQQGDIHAIVNKANDAGIGVRGLFMVGYPGETWESVEETATLIKALPLDSISIHLFTPFPGTDPYHNPDKYGITWISGDFDLFRSHPVDGILRPVFSTNALSTKTLVEMHTYLESVKSTESM